jgi:2-methylisocitrate lyase-like PEP mutase family enzyme
MGLADRRSIRTFVEAVRSPVNVMARKGLPSVPVLRSLGVKRLSLGPTPMYASMGLLRSISRELKETGTYRTLLGRAITFDELNALSHPRSD